MLTLENTQETEYSNSSSINILHYEQINSNNISLFRQQNSLLFPVIYPESFYRNILHSTSITALLVFKERICIGSVSTRLESMERWNEISSGRTVDNFNPSILSNDRVLAAHRYLGIGAEILEKIISDSKRSGIECIGLHVHIENRSALRFYDRRGFKILGKVDNYYKKISPNSAYILELRL